MNNDDNDAADQPAEAAEPAETAKAAEQRATRPSFPLATAAFPSMASDRVWGQATALDLLDLANAAVRRLEVLACLIGESRDTGGSGSGGRAGQRRTGGIAGIAELLDDVAVSLRVVVAEMERRQGLGGERDRR